MIDYSKEMCEGCRFYGPDFNECLNRSHPEFEHPGPLGTEAYCKACDLFKPVLLCRQVRALERIAQALWGHPPEAKLKELLP